MYSFCKCCPFGVKAALIPLHCSMKSIDDYRTAHSLEIIANSDLQAGLKAASDGNHPKSSPSSGPREKIGISRSEDLGSNEMLTLWKMIIRRIHRLVSLQFF